VSGVQNIKQEEWDELLDYINDGECTPFIGAGACYPILPLAKDISQKWASEFQYPFEDKSDLGRVAQFLAIKRNEVFPKSQIRRLLEQSEQPDFSEPGEPHSILAELNLPIYITTNYDNFMSEALRYHHRNDVKVEFCRWNKFTRDPKFVKKPVFESGYEPTPASPLVYHLHGFTKVVQSMVLTESDYLDFLIDMSRGDIELPDPITRALASTSLLFMGYSLADWNFRVLFRGLINLAEGNANFPSVAVQLPQNVPHPEDALEYLRQYLEKIHDVKVNVYWGDAKEFAKELRMRWKNSDKDAA
jgi:hypothetical protein